MDQEKTKFRARSLHSIRKTVKKKNLAYFEVVLLSNACDFYAGLVTLALITILVEEDIITNTTRTDWGRGS